MLFAGCDWSDQWLDVAVLDRSGTVLAETRIIYAQSADPVARYREFLAPLGRRWRATVTGIEDVHLLFARSLAASGMEVVHVDPTRAARHRLARGISKTDRADARLIAAMTLAGECRPLVVHSPQAQALHVVAHAHRAAVADRAEAMHRLRAALTRFWPAAVAAWPKSVGGLRSAQARAVLAAAPAPRAAARLDRRRLGQLLTAAGRKRTVQDEAERLRMIFCRPVMLLDPHVEDAEALRVKHLLAALDHAARRADDLQRDLAQHYTAHPFHPLVCGIPGVGDILGAYLLAEIGDRPAERFGSGRSLAAYAGVAPVTWASGQTVRVAFRRASSVHLRSILHAVAFSMISHSPGAHAYYTLRRSHGDAHATALRKLGRKLVLCLYRCMASGLPYDDAIAFGYDPATQHAPTRPRRAPLDEAQIAQARDMLATPGATVTATAHRLGVSAQTIYRHVLGRPWKR
ncbi:IS110 family RNA-guided transposase [Streptomyces olivaceus]|uniref:IS110 family transposase n=1 Tax=Streptomyces olivaceus TaxID=47716 RepID=UPI0018854670|nr:IS110 family transposase [Streptomyces olivaceus]